MISLLLRFLDIQHNALRLLPYCIWHIKGNGIHYVHVQSFLIKSLNVCSTDMSKPGRYSVYQPQRWSKIQCGMDVIITFLLDEASMLMISDSANIHNPDRIYLRFKFYIQCSFVQSNNVYFGRMFMKKKTYLNSAFSSHLKSLLTLFH